MKRNWALTDHLSRSCSPPRIERLLANWAADAYFAMRRAGIEPADAGRIISEVLEERLLKNSRVKERQDEHDDQVPF